MYCIERITSLKRLRCAVNAAAGVEEAYRLRHAEKAKKVVVVGGGQVGCEVAEFMAEKGKKVTIVEMLDNILKLGNVNGAHTCLTNQS